jgi:hypothetical protein
VHFTILLGNSLAKESREDVFKPPVGNESYTKLVIIIELE